MEIVLKILQLILSLSLLVFVHELGHYLSSRMFGIRVDKFYIFFDAGGFSLFKFKIGETTFGLGWVPFGGYCKISGMIDESMDTDAMKQPPKPWEFRSKPAWQRFIVMISGVLMNVIAACIIFICMSWHWGDTYVDNKDAKWGYRFSSLAHEIGFADGDKIVSVNGEQVTDYVEIYKAVLLDKNPQVAVDRNGSMINITVSEVYTSRLLKSSDEPFLTPRMPFVIANLFADGNAAKAGMAVGDSLTAFNGVPMRLFDEYQKTFVDFKGETAQIAVSRDSSGVTVNRILPVMISEQGIIGVNILNTLNISKRDYNLWQAIPVGFRRTGSEISDYWKQLKMIFNPKTEAYKQVGSFIAIGNFFPGEWDWFRFWNITAFLSIILAVMNILPIPALDGGHVLFLLWEIITRRKPSDKFLEWMQIIGLCILFAIIILAFGNDIYRFFIK